MADHSRLATERSNRSDGCLAVRPRWTASAIREKRSDIALASCNDSERGNTVAQTARSESDRRNQQIAFGLTRFPRFEQEQVCVALPQLQASMRDRVDPLIPTPLVQLSGLDIPTDKTETSCTIGTLIPSQQPELV